MSEGAVESKPVHPDVKARCVTMAIVGGGYRGTVYAGYAAKFPDLAKVVAVADPRSHRRKVLALTHDIPNDMLFKDWRELHARGRVADVVCICVLDQLHAPLVEAFAPQGYHILCEKPMATSVDDCVKMYKHVESRDEIFGIGHVLRYSPYWMAMKKLIDTGALGEVVNIQHTEPIGNQHFAHSYVRGNWHREDESSFGLMTKCCHDIDILSFLFSGKKPTKLSSFGSLFQFRKDKKPPQAGSAKRCLDCPYESECAWSAKKIYVEPLSDDSQPIKWASIFVDADVLDIENVSDALRTGPYGVCVYENDNDIVDNQVVNIEFEGGVTAHLTMVAFSEVICQRTTRISGTLGEIIGDMSSFTFFDFLTREKTVHSFGGGADAHADGHGGGDAGLSKAFIEAVAKNDQTLLGVTPEDILNSHLMVFAAEEARHRGTVVDFEAFKAEALSR